MSKRLELIASHIRNGVGVIDVGTDHGYLPVMLAQRGYTGFLFASDINAAPLDAAKRTASDADVRDRIEFLLCDGLDACPLEKIDTIVIAGMGGDTIVGILDRADWEAVKRCRLVLQPMTKGEVLRYWLVNNGFDITAERLVRENGLLFSVLCAEYDDVNHKLRDAELFTGKTELVRDEPEFHALNTRLIGSFASAIDGMKSSEAGKRLPRLAIFEEILRELIENESK